MLSDLAKVTDCEHKTAPKSEAEHFAYSVGTSAVRNGRIDFSKAKQISADAYSEWTARRTPMIGELIMTREAPMGEVALVPPSPPVALGQRTVLISPQNEFVSPEYLHLWLLSPLTQQWIVRQAIGTTVLHLNVADVKRIPLGSIPPLAEQERIVSLLEEQFSRLDKALEVANQLEARIASERRSLLHSAFTGALTATWRLNND